MLPPPLYLITDVLKQIKLFITSPICNGFIRLEWHVDLECLYQRTARIVDPDNGEQDP